MKYHSSINENVILLKSIESGFLRSWLMDRDPYQIEGADTAVPDKNLRELITEHEIAL